MRSFTNRSGERIEVGQEFLDTAIRIMEELMKESPSRKVNWSRHKKMMEIEGFESDSNEAFRQMMKAERRSRGILPSAKTYAELASKSTLESIKEEIGELSYAKRDAQNQFRQLNKVKRELTDDLLIFDELERVIKENGVFKDFQYNMIRPVEDEPVKKMIVGISDLHYGSVVDVEGYKYSTSIAKELLSKYANEIINVIEKENVNYVEVVNLGDLIEHITMRAQNTYSSERLLSEQITEATDLIIDFLINISKYVNVQYTGINGNHDRLSGAKEFSIYGDGAVSISNKIIETFIKYSGTKTITFKQTEPYHYISKINERTFLFVHGDRTALSRKTILAEQSLLYGESFDAIIGGHVHHYTVKEVGEDKYVATFGSIKGSDEYSLKTIGTSSSRSQGIILIGENGDFEIRKINL